MALDWDLIRKEYETTDITLVDIAEKYDIKYPTIKSRKQRQGWEKDASKDASKTKKDASLNGKDASKKKRGPPVGSKNAKGHGAPAGNQNAVGNKGGCPAPGNKNAEKHGFFSRIFPDDEETREIIESINIKSPLEMLWENIVIQYTAIARAQRIMYVRDQDDLTKELKRQKQSSGPQSDGQEEEYELQFAWDKHASFLKAQSTAMKTLEGLITRYESIAGEEKQLKLEKMKAEIAKLTGADDQEEDNSDSFLKALSGKVKDVWKDE